MEVSSQALAQHRVDGAVMDVAGFTNFSQDHLELHGDMDTYLAAKALLLTPAHSRRAVVVVDDDGLAARRGRRHRAGDHPVRATRTRDADWRVARRCAPAPAGSTSCWPAGAASELALRCPLPGDFNVLNAALAAVMLLAVGLTAEQVRRGLRGRRRRARPDGAGRRARPRPARGRRLRAHPGRGRAALRGAAPGDVRTAGRRARRGRRPRPRQAPRHGRGRGAPAPTSSW